MFLEIRDPKITVNILLALRLKHREGDIIRKWVDTLLDQMPGLYTDPELCEVWALDKNFKWTCLNVPNWTFVPRGLTPVVPDKESEKEVEN